MIFLNLTMLALVIALVFFVIQFKKVLDVYYPYEVEDEGEEIVDGYVVSPELHDWVTESPWKSPVVFDLDDKGRLVSSPSPWGPSKMSPLIPTNSQYTFGIKNPPDLEVIKAEVAEPLPKCVPISQYSAEEIAFMEFIRGLDKRG